MTFHWIRLARLARHSEFRTRPVADWQRPA